MIVAGCVFFICNMYIISLFFFHNTFTPTSPTVTNKTDEEKCYILPCNGRVFGRCLTSDEQFVDISFRVVHFVLLCWCECVVKEKQAYYVQVVIYL
jgi:hypothetical protein